MSGNDKELGDTLLIPDNEERNIKAAAIKLDEAANGLGTDEDAIYDVLEKAKTQEEREAIAAELREAHPGMTLDDHAQGRAVGPRARRRRQR